MAKNFSDERAGDEVSLEFAGVERVPAHARVYLIDGKLKRMIDLRERSRYRFYEGVRALLSDENNARFKLIVGSERFASRHQDLPPTHTALAQNYPNPFNPSTIIRYEIATAGPVTLAVYNVTGARAVRS